MSTRATSPLVSMTLPCMFIDTRQSRPVILARSSFPFSSMKSREKPLPYSMTTMRCYDSALDCHGGSAKRSSMSARGRSNSDADAAFKKCSSPSRSGHLISSPSANVATTQALQCVQLLTTSLCAPETLPLSRLSTLRRKSGSRISVRAVCTRRIPPPALLPFPAMCGHRLKGQPDTSHYAIFVWPRP